MKGKEGTTEVEGTREVKGGDPKGSLTPSRSKSRKNTLKILIVVFVN